MQILRANHLGMCFGVRDAIALARSQPEPITILGDLVHNPTVLNDLQLQGVKTVRQVADVATRSVMITAHGASQRRLQEVQALGFNVIEATCPLVRFAHLSLKSLVQQGYHPVIIGQRDHVEVRGLTEDLAQWDVVQNEDDVAALQERPRLGVIAQTTQPINRVRRLVASIEERFPCSDVRLIDTVCQPTKQRQTAAVELAQRCDVVVVVGGANSNNTRELVNSCSEFCERVYQVQCAADLRGHWFDGKERIVGITAGTSTPDSVVDEVQCWLEDFARFQEALAARNGHAKPLT
jgi:4-hydroxy-3-methylbut-2-enyl diphosphate reductase